MVRSTRNKTTFVFDLGQIVSPHIDPAPDQRQQREQPDREHGQGVAGHIAPQPRQECPALPLFSLVRKTVHIC